MRTDGDFGLHVDEAGQVLVLPGAAGRAGCPPTCGWRWPPPATAAAASWCSTSPRSRAWTRPGLGVLVGAHRSAGRVGRVLVLRDVPPPLARALTLTRLDRVLRTTRAAVCA
jgi:hypothetical protein